jgi:ribulose-5-phosphate 4-epimerase/fuculose-1-phosphate aldolase
MTHGVVYAGVDSARWVVHAHSPEIWRQRRALNLPATAADIPYGTVEMAGAVRRLLQETGVARLGIFAMDGHEDGIVTFGPTAASAAGLMIDYLSRAYQLGD